MPRRHARALSPLFVVMLFLLPSCGGGDSATTTTTTSAAPAVGSEHDDHGGAGHAMGVEQGSVEDVAALGPGASVGQRWEIPVGLNVCGRFVEAPTGGPAAGVSADGRGGIAVVEPTDESEAGTGATLGDYARAAGISLSTGQVGLPEGVIPSTIEVGEDELELPGQDFSSGDECGTTTAEVQVWVYSADAVTSGEGILTVVTDPERIPFAQDGMAMVIALAPESSLPTLPPSALGLG